MPRSGRRGFLGVLAGLSVLAGLAKLLPPRPADAVFCPACGAEWEDVPRDVHFEWVPRLTGSYRTALDGHLECHECSHREPMTFGWRTVKRSRPDFRDRVLVDFMQRRRMGLA